MWQINKMFERIATSEQKDKRRRITNHQDGDEYEKEAVLVRLETLYSMGGENGLLPRLILMLPFSTIRNVCNNPGIIRQVCTRKGLLERKLNQGILYQWYMSNDVDRLLNMPSVLDMSPVPMRRSFGPMRYVFMQRGRNHNFEQLNVFIVTQEGRLFLKVLSYSDDDKRVQAPHLIEDEVIQEFQDFRTGDDRIEQVACTDDVIVLRTSSGRVVNLVGNGVVPFEATFIEATDACIYVVDSKGAVHMNCIAVVNNNGNGQYGVPPQTPITQGRWMDIPFIQHRIRKVIAAPDRIYFLSTDRTAVYVSGTGRDGVFGDGIEGERSYPQLVLFELPEEIMDIAVSDSTTVLLGVSGRLWGCGLNRQGQLGVDPSFSPVVLRFAQFSSVIRFKSVHVNVFCTFAIERESGQVWGCGRLRHNHRVQGGFIETFKMERIAPLMHMNVPDARCISFSTSIINGESCAMAVYGVNEELL